MKYFSTFLYTYLFTALSVVFLIIPIVTNAQNERSYVPLAPLPYTTNSKSVNPNPGEETTFSRYLVGAYQLFFGIAGILAVIMIIFGGFQYATTDAIGKKEDGRAMIQNAIYGLLLALGAYLILYTINPRLLDFNININRPSLGIAPTSSGTIPVSQSSAEEQQARTLLASSNLDVNNNPCAPGATQGCTNLAGLPTQVFSTLSNMEQDCNCQITITGGTEDGHYEHGVGVPIVDLRNDPNLITYIKSGTFLGTSSIGDVYRIGNNNFVLESNHVHACIGRACGVSINN